MDINLDIRRDWPANQNQPTADLQVLGFQGTDPLTDLNRSGGLLNVGGCQVNVTGGFPVDAEWRFLICFFRKLGR